MFSVTAWSSSLRRRVVSQFVWNRVPDNWFGDRNSMTAECTALMAWHNQLVTMCWSQSLTTGDVGDSDAAVSQACVLRATTKKRSSTFCLPQTFSSRTAPALVWHNVKNGSFSSCQSLALLSICAFDWYQNRWPWMTLNSLMALILRYFTEFGSFGGYYVKWLIQHTFCDRNVARKM